LAEEYKGNGNKKTVFTRMPLVFEISANSCHARITVRTRTMVRAAFKIREPSTLIKAVNRNRCGPFEKLGWTGQSCADMDEFEKTLPIGL